MFSITNFEHVFFWIEKNLLVKKQMLLSCCRYYPVKNCHKELIKIHEDCGLKYLKNWIIHYSNFDKNVNGD